MANQDILYDTRLRERPGVTTAPLHDSFGVQVRDIDLRGVTADGSFPAIRALFEAHSLLLFRDQTIDAATHRLLAALFGPLEDLSDTAPGTTPVRPMVSNLTRDGALAGEDDLSLLNLQSNFIWHTDSTFLATPSISNVLVAYRIPSTGGESEFVSTRHGWRQMDEKLKAKAQGKVFLHRYAHSRRQVDQRLGEQEMFTKWPDQAWRSTWRNPVNGEEALYIAAHAYGVCGMNEADGQDLLDALTDAVTQPEAIYRHHWREGDVLIWDERATLHRGRPWPYDQERTLSSICSTALESDGLDSVRP